MCQKLSAASSPLIWLSIALFKYALLTEPQCVATEYISTFSSVLHTATPTTWNSKVHEKWAQNVLRFYGTNFQQQSIYILMFCNETEDGL